MNNTTIMVIAFIFFILMILLIFAVLIGFIYYRKTEKNMKYIGEYYICEDGSGYMVFYIDEEELESINGLANIKIIRTKS